jgi:hypothetical protein
LLPTLQSFATIYRRSASARRDAVKDYTLDYEIFLRTAGLDDGDEREIAEKELLLAETSSGGLFLPNRRRLPLRLTPDPRRLLRSREVSPGPRSMGLFLDRLVLIPRDPRPLR